MNYGKKEVDMLSGSVVRGLFKIVLPIMIMNVIMSLFNIVDMTILKIFDSDNGYSVGAVGSCGMAISLITGLLIGISAGANVIIARYIGSGDTERVYRAIGTAVLFSLAGGAALAIIGVSGASLILGWMNCPVELIDGAILYFRMYFAGVPILMLYNFTAAILRSSGNSRGPMMYLTIGGVVKCVLTLLFVGSFSMGITGVATATIISWAVSAILGVRALIKSDGTVKIKRSYLRFYKKELKEMLFIGVPAGLQQALYSIANVIITATVNSFGPAAATGISIANNFDGILYQISCATSIGVMPYVSQNIGKGNFKRAGRSVTSGILITVALGAFFGSLSAIFSSELSSIMSNDPTVIAYSRQKMIIISSTYFICGINEIMGAALRGMGRPIVATTATLIFMCAIRFVWVYAVFPLYKNLTFLYLIWPIGWVLSIITLLCFYFPTLNKLKKSQSNKIADF